MSPHRDGVALTKLLNAELMSSKVVRRWAISSEYDTFIGARKNLKMWMSKSVLRVAKLAEVEEWDRERVVCILEPYDDELPCLEWL